MRLQRQSRYLEEPGALQRRRGAEVGDSFVWVYAVHPDVDRRAHHLGRLHPGPQGLRGRRSRVRPLRDPEGHAEYTSELLIDGQVVPAPNRNVQCPDRDRPQRTDPPRSVPTVLVAMKLLQQMQALIGVLALIVVVTLYAQRALRRARRRRATTTSNAFEVIDEVFSPARHATTLELRARQQQGPITPAPDDWLLTQPRWAVRPCQAQGGARPNEPGRVQRHPWGMSAPRLP